MGLVVGWPSAVGGRCIFWNSKIVQSLGRYLAECSDRTVPVPETETGWTTAVPPFIKLGNSAYANSKRVVTTFELTGKRRSPVTKELNNRLASVRLVVERAFGILKSHWWVFRGLLPSHNLELTVNFTYGAPERIRWKLPTAYREDRVATDIDLQAALEEADSAATRARVKRQITRDKLRQYIEYRRQRRITS
ncbi:MAG: hypothetical protein BJ554DRAFT_1402 [Olpidium bornovanus]|uniref:DDE Tnp4 domain-containing protein n=1 Tax=Olpidium bornovanus TaxID=278681 RepID=A0A8H8DH41_9FUNG|nr:MAG: hypothetical protein BJ554DRAFT_1402 [Olpidium bornovanus]